MDKIEDTISPNNPLLRAMQHCVPDDEVSLENLNAVIDDPKMAKWMCERLVSLINDFESDLPDSLQAGGRLVSFQNTTFSIDDVSYWNPDAIMFDATLPDGSKVQLVQHTSQLNLLLVAVPRSDTSTPRRKIGFERDAQEEK